MTTLTFEKLKEIMDNMPKDPLYEFAKSKGFDLDKGDIIILPLSLIEKYKEYENRKGVHFSMYTDDIILMKGEHTLWQQYPKF